MTDLQHAINELNKLIISGDTIAAMEIFYADDVAMQENDEAPRKGKTVCIAAEKSNLQKVKAVENKLLNQAVDETNKVVFSEWQMLITYNDNSKYMLIEVSVQHWADRQIVKEKFYYKNMQPIE